MTDLSLSTMFLYSLFLLISLAESLVLPGNCQVLAMLISFPSTHCIWYVLSHTSLSVFEIPLHSMFALCFFCILQLTVLIFFYSWHSVWQTRWNKLHMHSSRVQPIPTLRSVLWGSVGSDQLIQYLSWKKITTRGNSIYTFNIIRG